MNVEKYIFQSPYSSQFQVGRAEASTASQEESSNSSPQGLKSEEQVKQQAPTFQPTQTEKDEALKSINSIDKLLDIYA